MSTPNDQLPGLPPIIEGRLSKEGASHKKHRAWWILWSSVAAFVLVAVISPFDTKPTLVGALLVALLVALSVTMWRVAVNRKVEDRVPGPEQVGIQPDSLVLMSSKAFSRMRFRLGSDVVDGVVKPHRISRVTRQHWIILVLPAVISIVMVLGCAYGAVRYPYMSVGRLPLEVPHLSVNPPTGKTSAKKHHAKHVQSKASKKSASASHKSKFPLWPFWLAGVLPFVVFLSQRLLKWLTRFRMITDHHLCMDIGVPPAVFPWMLAPFKIKPVGLIKDVEHLDTFWGGLLGYGHVRVKLWKEAEPDKWESVLLKYVPQHDQFAADLRAVSPSINSAPGIM